MEKLDKLKLIQTYLDKLDSDFNVSSPTEIEDHIRDFESDDIEIDDINKIYDELEIELEYPDDPDTIYYSREEFEMYMKRYKVFERSALKFKKELIIESKKLELEDDFNADDGCQSYSQCYSSSSLY